MGGRSAKRFARLGRAAVRACRVPRARGSRGGMRGRPRRPARTPLVAQVRVSPPSTASVWPVMKAESSEAKNETAPTRSLGLLRALDRLELAREVEPAELLLRAGERSGRADEAWGDRVDGDAGGPDLGCQRAHEADHGALARGCTRRDRGVPAWKTVELMGGFRGGARALLDERGPIRRARRQAGRPAEARARRDRALASQRGEDGARDASGGVARSRSRSSLRSSAATVTRACAPGGVAALGSGHEARARLGRRLAARRPGPADSGSCKDAGRRPRGGAECVAARAPTVRTDVLERRRAGRCRRDRIGRPPGLVTSRRQ